MLESLKNSKQFRYVYQEGRSFANKYLVMYVVDNHLGRHRLGISVSRKVGNSVVRHRLVRLLRESGRLHEQQLSASIGTDDKTSLPTQVQGKDIVVVVRTAAKDQGYWGIESAFLHLARRHRLI